MGRRRTKILSKNRMQNVINIEHILKRKYSFVRNYVHFHAFYSYERRQHWRYF